MSSDEFGYDRPDANGRHGPEGLTVVPNVGDEGTEPVNLEEVTEEQVEEVFQTLERQNGALINQLQILGKTINPLLLIKLQVDVLLDFVMADEAARKQYDTACSMRLNEALKVTLAQVVGAQVDG